MAAPVDQSENPTEEELAVAVPAHAQCTSTSTTDPEVASSALDNPEWEWVKQLVLELPATEQNKAAQLFTRMLEATTALAVGDVLDGIDQWELSLDKDRKALRALKLLGIDKKLALEHTSG